MNDTAKRLMDLAGKWADAVGDIVDHGEKSSIDAIRKVLK